MRSCNLGHTDVVLGLISTVLTHVLISRFVARHSLDDVLYMQECRDVVLVGLLDLDLGYPPTKPSYVQISMGHGAISKICRAVRDV
jgi:hypothetical protein